MATLFSARITAGTSGTAAFLPLTWGATGNSSGNSSGNCYGNRPGNSSGNSYGNRSGNSSGNSSGDSFPVAPARPRPRQAPLRLSRWPGRMMPRLLRHQLTCVLMFGGCSGPQCIPGSGPTQKRAVNRAAGGPSRWRGPSGLHALVDGEQSGTKNAVNIIGSTRRRLSGPRCRLAIGG